MPFQRLARPALLAAALFALLLTTWQVSGGVPVGLREDGAGISAAQLVLSSNQRDFGTVAQGIVLEAAFTVENRGTRRLVLREEVESCCGEATDSRSFILASGESKELVVEADTTVWCGRMEHTVRYRTNDPARPQFVLEVTADVQSPASFP